MKKIKTLFLIILVLILIAPALSLEVNSAWLEWRGETIEVVGERPQPPIIANLRFSLQEIEEVQRIVVDARELNIDIRSQNEFGYDSLEVLPRDCTLIDERYECIIRGVRVYLEESNPFIKFDVTTQDGEITPSTTELQLTIDNSKPEVVSIRKENCDENCMVAPNIAQKILIETTGSSTGFSRNNNVFFRVGNRYSAVSSCEDNICEGFITPSCTSGQTVNLQITANQGDPNQPSRDDAGIRLEGLRQQSFICDGVAPEITNFTILNEAGSEIVSTEDRPTIRLEIEDRIANQLIITANLESIGLNDTLKTTCTDKVDNTFVCTKSLDPIPSSGTYTIPITVQDNAGNVANKDIRISIRAIDDSEVNFWSVNEVILSASSINKRNLAYARDIFAEVELRANNPQITINTISLDETCTPLEGNRNYGVQGDIFGHRLVENADIGFISRFSVREYGENYVFRNRYENVSQLRFHCPVTITSKSPQRIYTHEEKYNYTVVINLRDEPGISGSIKQEIERVENNFNSFDDGVWGTFRRGVSMANTGCELASISSLVFQTLGITFAARETLLLPVVPGYQASLEAERELLQTQQQLKETMLEPVQTLCKYLTCQENPLEWLSNTAGVGSDAYEQLITQGPIADAMNSLVDFDSIGQTIRGGGSSLGHVIEQDAPSVSDVLNPYKSEYIAWASLCAPAIMHHQEEKMAIQCTYAECLSRGVGQLGMTVNDCKMQRDFSECVREWGSILDAFLPTAMIREYTGIITNILSDPVVLFGSGGLAVVCNAIPAGAGYGVCTSVRSSIALFEQITMEIQAWDGRLRSAQQLFNPQSICTGIFGNINQRNTYYEQLSRGRVGDIDSDLTDPMMPRTYSVELENGETKEMSCNFKACNIHDSDIRLVFTHNNISGANPQVGPENIIVFQGNTRRGYLNDIFTQNQDIINLPESEGTQTNGEESAEESGRGFFAEEEPRNVGGTSSEGSRTDTEGTTEDTNRDMSRIINEFRTIDELAEATVDIQAEFYRDVIQNPGVYGENTVAAAKNYMDSVSRLDLLLLDEKLEYDRIMNDPTSTDAEKKDATESLNELRQQRQELDNELIAAIQQDEFDEVFGFSNRGIQTAFGIARGLNTIKTLFRVDNFMSWSTIGLGFMDDFANFLETRIVRTEVYYCENKFLRSETSNSRPPMNFRTSSTAQLGAYMSGTITENPNPQEAGYIYFISGGIRAKQEGLEFTIELEDDRGIVRDITNQLFGRDTLLTRQNQVVALSTTGVLQYSSTRKYDRVCMVLKSGEITDYFDTVSSNTRICQRFIEE